MKIGFYSPLPPARTGVADYSAALLRALREFGSVEPGSTGDVNLYHIGNNHLHGSIYREALRNPGVVVLHDAVLHHFFLGALPREQYIEEFVYNYGEWTRDVAAGLWAARARSAADERYFRYPMVRRIAEVSPVVVVHNPGAAAIVRAHAPGARIVEIPHLFSRPVKPSPSAVAAARQRFGHSTFVFGIFGHLRESKRVLAVLRTFQKIRRHTAKIALLLSGDCVSSDLQRAMQPYLAGPSIVRTGYLSEAEFWAHAAAVDACINLRYPAAGESSGISIRLMGIGKPVLVTGGIEVQRFPRDSCLRVDSGLSEEAMLGSYLTFLAQSPEHASEIGRRAAGHIEREHAVERAAHLYWQALSGKAA